VAVVFSTKRCRAASLFFTFRLLCRCLTVLTVQLHFSHLSSLIIHPHQLNLKRRSSSKTRRSTLFLSLIPSLIRIRILFDLRFPFRRHNHRINLTQTSKVGIGAKFSPLLISFEFRKFLTQETDRSVSRSPLIRGLESRRGGEKGRFRRGLDNDV